MMFTVELAKYSKESPSPIVVMYDDLGREAFALIVQSASGTELEEAMKTLPPGRNDILLLLKGALL